MAMSSKKTATAQNFPDTRRWNSRPPWSSASTPDSLDTGSSVGCWRSDAPRRTIMMRLTQVAQGKTEGVVMVLVGCNHRIPGYGVARGLGAPERIPRACGGAAQAPVGPVGSTGPTGGIHDVDAAAMARHDFEAVFAARFPSGGHP